MADTILVDYPCMGFACYFPDHDSLLRDSTARFLAAVATDPDASVDIFLSTFSRVLHAYHVDPPLEAVWFYAAVTIHDARGEDLRDILYLFSAFTASSPAAAMPLALLAPAISELFHSANSNPRRKIEVLADAILRYIRTSTTSRRPAGDADAGRLLPVFGELVKVSTVRNSSRDNCPFEVLFPLAGDDTRRELMKEGCSVSFLAGVVVAEAFLLRLCLKVHGVAAGVVPHSELRNRLRIGAVSSITVFQNQQFFRVLVDMLVNPDPLPVYSPFSADDEASVRDVLYDALILMDYSVLSGARVDHQADDGSLFPISVSRLVMTVEATNDASRKGDQARAMSYINAFSTSNIPGYLTRLAIRRAGTDRLCKPTAITPQAFLKWLVDLEDEGWLKVFGDNGYSNNKQTNRQ